MRDINKAVRLAFMQALDAQITYNGAAVPVYHEEGFDETQTLYIVLHTQTSENRQNKAAFDKVGTILVDVVYRSDRTSYEPVDDVANGVMQILQPTPQSHGLTAPDWLQIWDLRFLSDTPFSLYGDEGNTLRRLLRYEYKTTEL